MEQFVSCPFAHFIRYGLKAKERKVFEVRAPDIGELLHNTILSFTESLAADNIDWRQLPKEDCIFRVDKVMEELLPVQGNGVLQSTFRYRYLATRLQRIARRAIWTLTEHLKQGEFEFLGHEITFGRNGCLPAIEIELLSGERIYLEGRIDRVDLLREDNTAYVKIIDYKTGEKQLSLSDIYSGLALQLIIYLAAVLDSEEILNEGALKAAGIFYFKIDDPLVDTKDKIIEKIELEIARRLKMKGVVLQNVKLVQQMDRDIQGYSNILPVAVNKNGEFYSNSSVLMEEDFRALIVYAKNLVKQIGQEIMAGKISIEPVKKGRQTACAYCHYRSICHFDKLFAGNKFKNIYDMSNEEVMENIKRSPSGYFII
jgi:ATP-dependent helicase/nuclease subunit B